MRDVLTLDHAVIPYFARCQDNGLPIDRQACASLESRMLSEMEALTYTLHDQVGYWLNPNSDDQVRTLLRELLPAHEIDNLVLTPGGEISTGKKVIEALRGLHPPIDSVINYRQRSKIATTYAGPLAREIDPPPPAEPHRARCNLRITRVASGRLAAGKRDEGGASSLTIPVRTELGREVRKCYAVRHPNRRLVAVDLSQIEFRVAAHLSGDPTMCAIFEQGLDLHLQTASRIFGIEQHLLDKWKHRYPAKTAGFGILYGITAKGLLDQMRMAGQGAFWDEARCQKLIDDWYAVFPGVEQYILQARHRAQVNGFSESMAGRRRYLPGAASELSWIREEAWRQAVSLEIQGTAQDILKEAMAELWDWLQTHWVTDDRYCEPLLQVHDELLFEVDETLVDELIEVVTYYMTQTTPLSIPLKASGGSALDWGSLEK